MARRNEKKEVGQVHPPDPVSDKRDPVSLPEQITIEANGCKLVVEANMLLGTGLHRATCNTGTCVAISKSYDVALEIYRILVKCDHPNILKPIGIFKIILHGKITIEANGCKLVVEANMLPGTGLHRATCNTGTCVAISKSYDVAIEIYRILVKCDHPNILKPIGIWRDPANINKVYLVFEEVQGSIKMKGKEYIFSMEDSSIYGFSDNGFKIFRDIFSVVDYINKLYKEDIGSTSNDTVVPVYALKLGDSNIFYKATVENEVLVLLGDFHITLPVGLRKKTKKGKAKVPTLGEVQQFNWKSTGEYLSSFFKEGDHVNEEITSLVEFLKGGLVNYDDLLWQAGIWEANVKMQFIREIWWHVDGQRDRLKSTKLRDTEKGQVLHKIKRPLGIITCIKKLGDVIVENTLLDSLEHLRDYIVAHHGESYRFYKGCKDEIGCDKVKAERFVQKTKGDYMINLIKEIRSLGWITIPIVTR